MIRDTNRILKYHNAKIARNGAMLHFHAEHRDSNASSIMVPTNLNTTINLPSTTR